MRMFWKKLLEWLAPALREAIRDALNDFWFEWLYQKNKKLHNTIVASAYPGADAYLEALAQRSKTKLDDAVIGGLKLALEERAKIAGIELPNIDDDK